MKGLFRSLGGPVLSLSTIGSAGFLGFGFQAESSAAGSRYALLIGIEHYPHLGDVLPGVSSVLPGPLSDVLAIKQVLIEKFDFQKNQIIILSNERANKRSIRTALRRDLRRRLTAEDVVLIFFSGHGTSLPDKSGDEEDGREEALVCADFGGAKVRAADGLVIDDELGKWLREMSHTAARITVVIDACHSGTVSRGLETVPKKIDLPYEVVEGMGGWDEKPPMVLFPAASQEDGAPVWLLAA